MEDPYLYRLATPHEWATAQKKGTITAREIDTRDGFYHLSTAGQMILTANLYFAEHERLVVLLFSREDLEVKVKWEFASSRHDEFPHYYGSLLTEQVQKVMDLEREPGGSFGIVTRGVV